MGRGRKKINDLAREKAETFKDAFPNPDHQQREIQDEIEEIEEQETLSESDLMEVMALRQAAEQLEDEQFELAQAKEKAEEVAKQSDELEPEQPEVTVTPLEPEQSFSSKVRGFFSKMFAGKSKTASPAVKSKTKSSSWWKKFNPAVLALFVGAGEVAKNIDLSPEEAHPTELSVTEDQIQMTSPEAVPTQQEEVVTDVIVEETFIDTPEVAVSESTDTVELNADMQTPWQAVKLLIEQEGKLAQMTPVQITKLTRNLALIQKIDAEMMRTNNIAVPEWGIDGDLSHTKLPAGTKLNVEPARTLTKKLIASK